MEHKLIAATLVVLAFHMSAKANSYLVETVSAAGYTNTTILDINNRGDAVGTGARLDSNEFQWFQYQNQTLTLMPQPTGAIASAAQGISDEGVVVGYFLNAADNGKTQTGFIFENGQYRDFQYPGASSTILRSISPDGNLLLGYYDTPEQSLNAFAFNRSTGLYIEIGHNTIPKGINSGGQLLGTRLIGQNFIFNLATLETANFGASNERYRDIDNKGNVVGFRTSQDGYSVILFGQPDTVSEVQLEAFISAQAYGLNDLGQIGGSAVIGIDQTVGIVLTPVPDSPTQLLFTLGLLLMSLRINACKNDA